MYVTCCSINTHLQRRREEESVRESVHVVFVMYVKYVMFVMYVMCVSCV